MTALTNPRWEHFAQEVAAGRTADEAYKNAGFNGHRGNASRLRSIESIRARIAEIVQEATRNNEVTIESLMREASEIQRLATSGGQYSAATAAMTAKAKLAGLWIEKSDNVNRNTTDPHALPDDTLADIAVRDAPRPEPPLQPMLDPTPADSDEHVN